MCPIEIPNLQRDFFCVVCAVQIMIIEFFYWHYKFLYFFLLNSISKTLHEKLKLQIFSVCAFLRSTEKMIFLLLKFITDLDVRKLNEDNTIFILSIQFCLLIFFFSSFSQGFSSVTFYILILYAPHEAIKKWLLI